MAFTDDSTKIISRSLITDRSTHMLTKFDLLVTKTSRMLLILVGKSTNCDKSVLQNVSRIMLQ